MMTKQEIFDTVVTHLRAQGIRSMRGCTCVYRGPEGRKCAIGALIPDEDFKPEWEGYIVGSRSEEPGNQELQDYFVFKFGLHNIGFLIDLQRLHDRDDLYTPSWEEQFVRMATNHGLTIPESKS